MATSSEQLLSDLAARDVVLTVEGEGLRVDAPKGVLTDELRCTLGENKGQLIELIRHQLQSSEGKAQPSVEQISAMPLEEFATSGLVLRVRSEVLACTVLFAADNAPAALLERLSFPVYRAAELRKVAILRPEPRELQTLHDAKTIFKGEISDAETE